MSATELRESNMTAEHHDDATDTATRLQEQNPGWLILFGSWTRQYIAFPLFPAPYGSYVAARDPRELARGMRLVESSSKRER